MVQALLIFNIGDSELAAGELRTRVYYQGSNVSCNLKKLFKLCHINHKRSDVDRRSVRVSLTQKGLDTCKLLDELYDKHVGLPADQDVADADSLSDLNASFKEFERFRSEQIRHLYQFFPPARTGALTIAPQPNRRVSSRRFFDLSQFRRAPI